MKKLLFSFIILMLSLTSCKKDSVDATNTKTFQSSINDMASSLNTLQQVKFNEALYILKTFGVEGDTDMQELANLGKLLNGKKVPEIMAMADQVAQKNGIAWSSTGPPSLGEMNIFGDEKASETDNNDIKAASMSITATPIQVDSVLGPKAIQIIPKLVDRAGNPVEFSNAALETVMAVSNNGNTILTSKNLMQDNRFKGFTVRMASLPKEKVQDGTMDVTITVKASNKTYKMTKIGIPVNQKALLMPQGTPANTQTTGADNAAADDMNAADSAPQPSSGGDPKTTVTSFLNNLSAQNLQSAFSKADNPAWGSYENFANPNTGFGGVKGISVKNISTANKSDNSATVDATYDVTDQSGKVTALNVVFGLKNVNGEWKISSYKIK